MESAGLLSKGRAKRATESPIHLVRGAGAVGDSKKGQELLSIFHAHSPTAKNIKSL